MSVAQFDSTPAGLAALNDWLLTRSFCDEDGFSPSQTDTAVFKKLTAGIDAAEYPNVARWFRNIASYGADIESFPGDAPAAGEAAAVTSKPAPAKKASDDSDSDSDSDDDFEIEDSDSDDDDDLDLDELERERREKQKAKEADKLAKAKSIIVLYVKPFEVSQDPEKTKQEKKYFLDKVKGIEMEGLTWGKESYEEIGYGIWKMLISVVVLDAKVSVDDLQEKIADLDDGELVQSTEIASFNKL